MTEFTDLFHGTVCYRGRGGGGQGPLPTLQPFIPLLTVRTGWQAGHKRAGEDIVSTPFCVRPHFYNPCVLSED